MRVVTVRDFRDRASEMFRSDDVILVTREGRPAGFFPPGRRRHGGDMRRECSSRLTEQSRRSARLAGDRGGGLGRFAAERGRR